MSHLYGDSWQMPRVAPMPSPTKSSSTQWYDFDLSTSDAPSSPFGLARPSRRGISRVGAGVGCGGATRSAPPLAEHPPQYSSVWTHLAFGSQHGRSVDIGV